MCFVKYCFLFLCLLIISCHSLTCRTDGGPTESELKNIYSQCLKMQDLKNSSNSRTFNEQDWEDSRDDDQRDDWDRSRAVNTERKKSRNNEMNSDNRKRDNIDRGNSSNDMDNRNESKNDRRNNKNNNMMSNRGDQKENNRLSGNNDFQNNEHDSYMSHYNGYYSSSTQPSRRYKRERGMQNSGNRSQYNPNLQRSYEDTSRSDGKNSNESNSSVPVDSKACAMHCFLENLEMTGEDNLPDRYLVTQALTKYVKNEDLRDFLQESIEECFQILDNENASEKCEFSKNLLICLSEKGESNCDDWKGDLKF